MLFDVTHRTIYHYSAPVTLDPHVIRMRPRSDGAQQILRYEEHITPTPILHSCAPDITGNPVTYVRFEGQPTELIVEISFGVETMRENAFDYLVSEAGAMSLPALYSENNRLGPCLLPYEYNVDVQALSERIAAESGHNTMQFLSNLNYWIQAECKHYIREEGEPLSAATTLAQRAGSCRDLAVLFIDVCRMQGVAARFVSGYHAGEPDHDRRYLHAWAEVYLPGGGWRGYDPTHAVAVANRHVAVAAAPHPRDAAPIIGAYRGDGITSKMSVEISINSYAMTTPTW